MIYFTSKEDMDLIQNVRTIKLFDIYGELLTLKQRQAFNLHVLKDLSLSETSSILKISRQAVKFAIDSAIKTLTETEEKLKFLEKNERLKSELKVLMDETNDEDLKAKILKILEGI